MHGFKKETTSNVKTTDASNAHTADCDGCHCRPLDPGIHPAISGQLARSLLTEKSRASGFFYSFTLGPISLTKASFERAVRHLCVVDSGLAEIVAAVGPPPFWVRPAGFQTLIQIILEQQVSLASAMATFDRLLTLAGDLTPARMLELGDDELRKAGFSRQKTRYCRIAASAVRDGELDLNELSHLGDEAVRQKLTSLTGIGPWTADVYLQMALRRPDIWPIGDVALQTAVQRFSGLQEKPNADEMAAAGESWRPFRTAAAYILWHGYLNLPPEAYR